MKNYIRVLSLCLFFLAACSSETSPSPTPESVDLPAETATQAAIATPDPSPEPSPTATSLPTNTPTAEPTATNTSTPTPSLEPTATPTVTPPPTDTPAPTATAEATVPLTISAVANKKANLRAGPGTDFAVVGQIAKGEELVIKGQTTTDEWLQLQVDGEEELWIATFLLDIVATPESSQGDTTTEPLPTPTPGEIVSVYEDSITIPTYPWQTFTSPAYDEAANWEYMRFDSAAYEAADPQPIPQSYQRLLLENQWLLASVLPELGGRLYQLQFKPTGNNELYQNPVIKPSPWGPGDEGNGWLAAGGIEWGYPVTEHGYSWGENWEFTVKPDAPAGRINVSDLGQDRLHVDVDIGLEPDSAAVLLDLTLENQGSEAVEASFWLNAMVAPGSANEVGPDLTFIVPGTQAQVHSSGESNLPGSGGLFDWPIYNERDVSQLGTWQRWLGFFAYPQAQERWSAVYDTSADEGLVRVFARKKTPGIKGFATGWQQPLDPNLYTDDGSTYVELQGGITPDFSTKRRFEPGERLNWREMWYPVAGLGGITTADGNGAVHLVNEGEGLRLRIFSNRTRSGELRIYDKEDKLLNIPLEIDPGQPADFALSGFSPPLRFQLQMPDGTNWEMSDLAPGG